MGINPTYTVFRQVCSVEMIQRHIGDRFRNDRVHMMVIGDGIGMLSSVFKAAFPNSTIILVDIGKSLMYQAYYIQRAYPDCVHEMADSVTDPNQVDFMYCPAEDLNDLKNLRLDAAANVHSMQEMNSKTIENYFSFMRAHFNEGGIFYCCNRVHKELVGGEVLNFYEYPWSDQDRFLVDEPCGWSRFYISRTPTQSNPRMLGIKVPFFNHLDGDVAHRLAILERR